jgi:hypothetical protein
MTRRDSKHELDRVEGVTKPVSALVACGPANLAQTRAKPAQMDVLRPFAQRAR